MATPDEIAQIADRFSVIANQFCSVVDSAPAIDRTELLTKMYRILPALIGEAIALPAISRNDDDEVERSSTRGSHEGRLSEQEWGKLYNFLKEKLGDWNLYHQVFDPTEDNESIFGSLADDIADIYRDLKDGLAFRETRQGSPDAVAIWTWHLLFYSHWGKHAMDALLTIHFRLQNDAP
jgi:Domain of unknown function (DUF5063)